MGGSAPVAGSILRKGRPSLSVMEGRHPPAEFRQGRPSPHVCGQRRLFPALPSKENMDGVCNSGESHVTARINVLIYWATRSGAPEYFARGIDFHSDFRS